VPEHHALRSEAPTLVQTSRSLPSTASGSRHGHTSAELNPGAQP